MELTGEQLNEILNRFLKWELPQDFSPDGGIYFNRGIQRVQYPTGTNLFTHTQARQMIEHILNIK